MNKRYGKGKVMNNFIERLLRLATATLLWFVSIINISRWATGCSSEPIWFALICLLGAVGSTIRRD